MGIRPLTPLSPSSISPPATENDPPLLPNLMDLVNERLENPEKPRKSSKLESYFAGYMEFYQSYSEPSPSPSPTLQASDTTSFTLSSRSSWSQPDDKYSHDVPDLVLDAIEEAVPSTPDPSAQSGRIPTGEKISAWCGEKAYNDCSGSRRSKSRAPRIRTHRHSTVRVKHTRSHVSRKTMPCR
ncbi:hypothetical protein MMC09_004901 [Bachmanniomyces sp. S44760]|nr:hypothetical protein [Bachmanniomyces sp. S44760]